MHTSVLNIVEWRERGGKWKSVINLQKSCLQPGKKKTGREIGDGKKKGAGESSERI